MRRKFQWRHVLTILVILACWVEGAEPESKGAQTKKPSTTKSGALARKQLTSGVVDDRSPSWSPDGRTIAFQRDWQIWVMDADGTNQRQLTKGPHKSGFPTWSPDGRLIAFHSNRRSGRDVAKGGNWDVWLMDKDGELAKLLVGDKGNEEFPYWSPDGQRLSFQYRRMGPGHEVYIVDMEGMIVGRPTIGERDDVFPMWCPDGKRLVLASAEPGKLNTQANIFTTDLEGKNRVQLTNGEHVDLRPCWSPDESKVAFQSNRSGNLDIWVVDVRTRELQQLTDSPADEQEPWWAPSGREVVYSSNAGKGAHIWVLTLGESSGKK